MFRGPTGPGGNVVSIPSTAVLQLLHRHLHEGMLGRFMMKNLVNRKYGTSHDKPGALDYFSGVAKLPFAGKGSEYFRQCRFNFF